PLPGEGLLRPPEVVLHLAVVLLLDRPLDLRQVRLRLAGVEALALRDLDVVDQGGELDLHLLAGDLALRAFQGFVQAELDLPHAFVLALGTLPPPPEGGAPPGSCPRRRSSYPSPCRVPPRACRPCAP